MKKSLLLVCCALFLSLSALLAQSPDAKNAFSYNVSIFDYYSPFTEDFLKTEGHTSLAAKLAYHRNLVGPLNLEVPFRLGAVKIPTPLDNFRPVDNSKLLVNMDALLQLQLFKNNYALVPYLSAGVGATFIEDRDMDVQIPLGFGLDLKLADGVYLQGRSEYRVSTSELEGTDKNLNNIAHNIGIKAFLDYNREPEAPADRDGDGVFDLVDACPDVAGMKTLSGCPDRDEDGVADDDDDCPDVAGEKVFAGCPDSDNDTVQDSEDQCPNVAGLAKFNGCPDSDADGIEDSKDACPNIYGVANFNGCPDTDSDGVEDAKDECPDDAGIAKFNGCPDSDNDNIPNKVDECPFEAGTVDNNGCPTKEVSEEDKKVLEFAAKNIQFGSNSSFLKAGSPQILDQVAEILLRYPDYRVNIDGYTDNVGKDSYNQWLSERRAERCYNYLQEKGVPASDMKFTGHGEINPTADNNTEAGRRLNRRVEFNLYLRE